MSDTKICGATMSKYSYIMYAVFGLVTFFTEAFIFRKVLRYVPHLIPEMKPDCRVNFPNPLINKIKIFIMDFKWINRWDVNYLVSFFLS